MKTAGKSSHQRAMKELVLENGLLRSERGLATQNLANAEFQAAMDREKTIKNKSGLLQIQQERDKNTKKRSIHFRDDELKTGEHLLTAVPVPVQDAVLKGGGLRHGNYFLIKEPQTSGEIRLQPRARNPTSKGSSSGPG